MKTALLRGATLALLCVALPASAETIGARYEIYAGGFQAIGIQARAVVTEQAYDVEADLKTTGIIDWFLRFSQRLEGHGRLGPATTPLL